MANRNSIAPASANTVARRRLFHTIAAMRTAFIQLHLAVLLAGFSGVLGKVISLNEGPLVWWRLLLAVALMLPWVARKGLPPLPSRSDAWPVLGAGALLGAHWLFFFASIRLANVSVALVCLSLMAFFSAIFSPLVLKTRWSGKEFLYSGLTIAGIALIFHFDVQHRLGIAIGVVSSAICGLFIVYNKKVQAGRDLTPLFFHEMVGGLCFITLIMPLYLAFFPCPSLVPTGMDLLYLPLLSFFCTIFMFSLQLRALRVVSAFTVNLSFNLEPVYSIILAAFLLGEAAQFTPSFYAGVSLIILSVALQTYGVWRERRGQGTADARG